MAHGDPPPARTPSSRGQRSSFFQGFFSVAVVQHVTFVTVFVELVEELYTIYGERPRAFFFFSGTVVVATLQPVE